MTVTHLRVHHRLRVDSDTLETQAQPSCRWNFTYSLFNTVVWIPFSTQCEQADYLLGRWNMNSVHKLPSNSASAAVKVYLDNGGQAGHQQHAGLMCAQSPVQTSWDQSLGKQTSHFTAKPSTQLQYTSSSQRHGLHATQMTTQQTDTSHQDGCTTSTKWFCQSYVIHYALAMKQL